jgi:hypothetical protein
MMEAEFVCETLVDLKTRLATREDFTLFCHGVSFKTGI